MFGFPYVRGLLRDLLLIPTIDVSECLLSFYHSPLTLYCLIAIFDFVTMFCFVSILWAVVLRKANQFVLSLLRILSFRASCCVIFQFPVCQYLGQDCASPSFICPCEVLAVISAGVFPSARGPCHLHLQGGLFPYQCFQVYTWAPPRKLYLVCHRQLSPFFSLYFHAE